MPITIGSITNKVASTVKDGATSIAKNTVKDLVGSVVGTINGPLAELESNKYGSNPNLVYPLDIEKYPHWIKFNINVPERTTYTKDVATDTAGVAGAGGVANFNQAAQAAKTGNVAGAVASGKAAVATGFFSALKTAGGAVLKALSKGKTAMAAGAGAAGLGVGAGTGLIVNSINSKRRTKRIVQSIFLYVPDTIQNQLVASYDAVSVTEALGNAGLIAAGADAVGTHIADAVKSLTSGNGLGSGMNAGAVGTYKEALGKLAEKGGMSNDVTGLLLKSAGLAQNPRIDILFKAINNREFQFDFKFTPTSQKEANEVLKIIKAFRFHAAPELIGEESAQRWLIPPSDFDIEICFDGQQNAAVHKFSTCVLEGIDVNYVTAGQWATHDDGMPVEIAMQLRFKEVEIMHKALIEEGY